MIIKNILVPVDFSPTSDAALAYARGMAETFGSTLHVLHVVGDLSLQGWPVEPFGVSGASISEQFRRQADVKLEKLIPSAQRHDKLRVVVTAVRQCRTF